MEADESDRSMLSLHVEIAVLTNVALDHHDTYGSLAELREAFRSFLSGAPQAVVWNRPDLLALRDGPVVAYEAADAELAAGGSRVRWRGHDVMLAVPGAHNASNAIAALEVARLAGADEDRAVAALATFAGAGRRFERLGHHVSGALVVDDYAHTRRRWRRRCARPARSIPSASSPCSNRTCSPVPGRSRASSARRSRWPTSCSSPTCTRPASAPPTIPASAV